MTRLDRADSGAMGEDGDQIRERRVRLGLTKVELAEAAGVTRETLGAIEAGKGFRQDTKAKIDRALDDAEAEAGIGAPPLLESTGVSAERHPVVIRLGNDAVVVEGFAEDMAALVEAARQLWAIEQGSDVTPVSDDGGPV